MKSTSFLKAAATAALTALIFSVTAKVEAQTKSPGNEIFTRVESSPEFPGGMNAFTRFLQSNIKYPAADRKNHVEGTAIVTFIVEKDGSLSTLKLLRTPGGSLGYEAVRVLKASPKWKPGYQNGRAVRTQFTVPVKFTLNGAVAKNNDLPGNELYIVDGKETTREEANKMKPSKILTISVWKGKDAVKRYGQKGAAGVVEIDTKK